MLAHSTALRPADITIDNDGADAPDDLASELAGCISPLLDVTWEWDRDLLRHVGRITPRTITVEFRGLRTLDSFPDEVTGIVADENDVARFVAEALIYPGPKFDRVTRVSYRVR